MPRNNKEILQALKNIEDSYDVVSPEIKTLAREHADNLRSEVNAHFRDSVSMLVGLAVGLLAGVFGAYIVHISINGSKSMTPLAWIVFGVVSFLIILLGFKIYDAYRTTSHVNDVFYDMERRIAFEKQMAVFMHFDEKIGTHSRSRSKSGKERRKT